MTRKSSILSALMFIIDFFSALFKELKKRNVTEEKIFSALKSKNELIPKMAEKIAELIADIKGILFPGNNYLKLLSVDDELIADACEDEVFEKADNVFTYIDSDFKNWGANEKQKATLDTPFGVYELQKDGTFQDFFTSVSQNLDSMCFTHGQMRNIVKKYRNWLRTEGYANFFLFKSKGKFFVANVPVFADGDLQVRVLRFEYDNVWNARFRPRVFLPAMAA